MINSTPETTTFDQTPPSFSSLLQNCSAAFENMTRQENRDKAYLCLGIGILSVATIAIFSSAFSNCNKVSVYNKTSQIVTISYVSPIGSKVNTPVLFPYTAATVTLNGINSYANLQTSAGEIHISGYGQQAELRDGEENNAVAKGNPPIFFWQCNYNYIEKSAASNTTQPAYVDFAANNTAYLRGSHQKLNGVDENSTNTVASSTQSTTTQSTRFSFLKPAKNLPQDTTSITHTPTSFVS